MQRICLKNLLFLSLWATTVGCGAETLPGTDENQNDDGSNSEQTCTQIQDCRGGEICQGGLCVPDPDLTENTPVVFEDGGIGIGTLSALPAQDIEFGAQQLGIPVTRQITLLNTGTAPLTLLFITLDDTSGEFALDPQGQLDQVLNPQETFHLEASHTPTDGDPDNAEIKVIHNGEGGLYRIGLTAEFKGDAVMTVSRDGFDISNSISTYAFGELAIEESPYTHNLWLTNSGSRDSILTVEDVTITPTGAGFEIADTLNLPWVLGARSTMACTEATAITICGSQGNGCINDVCTDTDGNPRQTFALPIAFSPQMAASQAVVTLFHTADETGHGDTVGQYEILLTGSPTLPAPSVSVSQLSFPSTLVGGAPSQASVLISNSGTGTLTYSLSSPNPAVFSWPASQPITGSVAPGETVTIDVLFTPLATQIYTGAFGITFNNGDASPTTVSLVGEGWSCPPHAHVTEGTTCTCDDGYNTCGSDCLPPSPDACGPSCITCDIRSGSDRDCAAETCIYECQDYRFDLNNDLDAIQGADSDGCEYTCANLSPQTEVCNGVDDDCDGQTDEDLEDDNYEPNESCSTASDLGDVTQERLYQVMLYPQDDEDWFFIRGLESDQNICNLCDVVDGASATQSYRATFSLLDVPADLDVALSVSADQCPTPTAPNDNAFVITSPTTAEEEEGLAERMYIRLQHDWQTESIDTLTCTLLLLYRESFGYSDEQLANELIGLGFEGNKLGCGFLDWRDYFINIRTTNDTQTCQPFTLRVTYESL